MHNSRAKVQPSLAASARMTCDFIERLAPEMMCWVLGSDTRGLWRWKTFQGVGRRALAERWVYSAYSHGAEIWLTLGDIAAPIEHEPQDEDIVATRFAAAYSNDPADFCGGSRPPHAAYYSLSGHAVGVWKLADSIGMEKAHWEARSFAADCCTKKSSVLPMSRCIPLPPDLYPIGYQGGCMARMAFKAPPYRPIGEVRALAAPVRVIDGLARPAIAEDRARADELVRQIAQFNVLGSVRESRVGPVVTTFLFVPAAGTKGSKVEALADDIGRVMRVPSARIVPIPRSDAVGVEIPNDEPQTVLLRSLLDSSEFVNSRAALPIALGVNTFGEPVVRNLADGPHWLVAGTSGSGKSVSINDMVLCLIARQSPAQCRLLLIDPKMTEFAVYDGLPHLLAPVVDTQAGAAKALRWLLSETMERYKLFKKIRGARNLAEYNAALKLRGEDELPYLVAFVDEAADLITSTGEKNSEESKNAAAIKAALQKLAQIARAAGVHMVLSMQRPSADIIDGAIRANFLARMAFLAASRVDAGVMGIPGSERCLGKGDGLYREGGGETIRIHSGYVDIAEIITIVDGLCATESPEYVDMGGDDSEGDGESDTHVSTAAPAKRSLDEVLKEALESGMKSRTALFDIAKANGYRSEGSLSSSLKRIGAYADGKEGFQAAALYRLP